MVHRRFWLKLLERAWKERSVVWLAGVRRVGKTCLCQDLPEVEYFDCELPRVRRMMLDPESFLDGLVGKRIVLDEIHRLQNPSELLKIAADHHSRTHIVATGSSFLRGGLPPFFLPEKHPERDFQEWMDAYWAKDIQELFRLERRDSFQRFTELVMAQSGGIFDATRFARPCEVSRPTIANYLRVLEATFVAHVIRPFSTRRPTEIVAAPKVYGFDTAFICYYRGWQDLRDDDLGTLWEHFVLNEIMARSQSREVFYWRDKRGHEVDFVIATHRKRPVAIECKWSANNFDPTNVVAFRHQHPEGDNIVLAHDVERAFTRNYGDLRVHFDGIRSFADSISS